MMISIVIPVYNVEKYLRRCVDSVLSQTYKDIEIILIDDGSKDKSGKICDEYEKKDSRVRAIHKENGGLSSARNRGIEEAQGEYIGFVDSDDYIDNDMYEVLYDELQKENADIAMCGLYDCYEGEKFTSNTVRERVVLNSEEAIKMVMEAKKTSVTAVNKLYRKEIFRELRYPINKLSEDAFVIVDVLMKAKTIVFISDQKYYYVHRKNSITTSGFKEKDLNVLEAYSRNKEIIEEYYPALKDVAEMRYMWAHFYVLDKMMLTKGSYDKSIKKRIISKLRHNYKFILHDPRFNKGRKVAMLLLLINANLYKLCVYMHRKEYID